MRTTPKIVTATILGAALISTAACSSSGSGSGSTPTGSAPSTGSSSSADTAPIATIATLTGKSTSVALDSNFVAALKSLKLTPSPFGTATISAAGVASFPITGGHVTLYKKGAVRPYVQGELDHNGSGLNLTSGATKVTLENFVIDPGSPATLKGDVLLNGKSAAKDAVLFTLDGSTLKPITTTAGVTTLTGTQVKVSSTAAGLLNMVFKTTAVKAGLLVGIATIKATGS